ncbi:MULTISPECIES: hypothetical protein [Methylobacterium]|uniref:hypothetical protein n=1 Tax=Methylobacterium TaxID=407 RepID=UPI0013EC2006|nr:hypothetical protein [Methylobacterium sp. DB0501]NGM36815.1 hypothetical protein [Methylobacterium sp. DB0501]
MTKPRSGAVGQHRSRPRRKAVLSGVASAGTGSGFIVWAQSLELAANTRVLIEAAAPWLAIGVASLSPVLAGMGLNYARYQGTRFLLRRAEKLCSEIPDDEANKTTRAQAEANVRELRQTLVDILKDQSRVFRIES